MTTETPFQPTIHKASVGKRMLQGAAIAPLCLLAFIATMLILGEGMPRPGFWLLLSVITMSVTGAFGGLFFFLMDYLRYRGQWQKIVSNIICGLQYLISMWLSLVFALALTGLWN